MLFRAIRSFAQPVIFGACIISAAQTFPAQSATLYAGNSGGIFAVETSTGDTDQVASSLNIANALAFGPDGLLYAANGTGGIFAIDVLTGDANRIALSINIANALAFGPDGLLYAGVGSNGIFSIDISTGATIPLPSSINIADALAFSSVASTVIPLPAAFPLFATALAGMGLLGWRRKRKATASV